MPETAKGQMILHSMDNYYVVVILGIMFATGTIGGLANFYNSKKEDKDWRKSILMGWVATFSVPLFLWIINNNLIATPTISKHGYLVFAGFCVVAAFYAGSYLEGLSISVLKNLQQKVEETKEKTDFLVETRVSSANKPSSDGSRGVNVENLGQELSAAKKVELVFNGDSVQTLQSLQEQTGLNASEIEKELDALIKAKKVRQIIHKSEKVFGWI